MNGRAGDLDAVLERLLLGIDAGKRRQQRRVNVEHGVGKRLEQLGADQPHEAREAHQGDVPGGQFRGDRPIEVVTRRELAMIDHQGLDAGLRAPAPAPAPAARLEITTRDARVEPAIAIAAISACRLLPRPEIRTPSDRVRAARRSGYRVSDTGAVLDLADAHVRPALRRGQLSTTASASARPQITIKPIPMLNVRSMSSSGTLPGRCSHSNSGGTLHVCRSMTAPRPSGRMRGRLSVIPPPVMWAIP